MAKKQVVKRSVDLFMNDEFKTFHTGFVSARNVFKAQDFFKRLDEQPEKEREIIDEIVEFIAKDIYKGQFTSDEFYDGIDAGEFLDTIQTQLLSVITTQVNETKSFLNQKK